LAIGERLTNAPLTTLDHFVIGGYLVRLDLVRKERHRFAFDPLLSAERSALA
jgi:hypothetical protein